MSTTDNAFSATLEPINTPKTTLKQRWWHIMDNWKVGIVPLPLFLLAGGLIALDCLGGKLPSDIVVMVATLAFFGFACGEFGKRLPVLGKLGAAAICATFIPSALVHYGLLPDVVVESTTKFYKSTNILYLYICCIIVGSIMSMSGFRYDMTRGMIGFSPQQTGDFSTLWSLEPAWGTYCVCNGRAALSVLGGCLPLRQLALPGRRPVELRLQGQPVSWRMEGEMILLEADIQAGQRLEIL